MYWEKEKKREKEGKKREKGKKRKKKGKKRRKRERKRKKGGKGWGKQSEMKKNMGEYLLILYVGKLNTNKKNLKKTTIKNKTRGSIF